MLQSLQSRDQLGLNHDAGEAMREKREQRCKLEVEELGSHLGRRLVVKSGEERCVLSEGRWHPEQR